MKPSCVHSLPREKRSQRSILSTKAIAHRLCAPILLIPSPRRHCHRRIVRSCEGFRTPALARALMQGRRLGPASESLQGRKPRVGEALVAMAPAYGAAAPPIAKSSTSPPMARTCRLGRGLGAGQRHGMDRQET